MTDQQLINEGYLDGKKEFDYCAKEIFDNFNFENVHKAMKVLDWAWQLGKDENDKSIMGIPTVDSIKREAYKHLKNAYDTGNHTGSGGFMAGWDDNELYLIFNLEQYSTEGISTMSEINQIEG